MRIRLFLILGLALFIRTNLIAQYDGLRITLWKSSLIVSKTKIISAYCNPIDSSYLISIKKHPDDRMLTDCDTVYKIKKEEFDQLAELCLGLSSSNIWGGFDLNVVSFDDEFKSSLLLNLMINGQEISYRIHCPFDMNNPHFKQFGEICEAIIMLAKEDTNQFLEIKTKKQ